mmetsp:Transcript_90785/g.236490  ORF Transcript_90785/g.236490 Transcript_90785/m.236490 type:complete len:240 (-) Transcript_90785:983-1702(-)
MLFDVIVEAHNDGMTVYLWPERRYLQSIRGTHDCDGTIPHQVGEICRRGQLLSHALRGEPAVRKAAVTVVQPAQNLGVLVGPCLPERQKVSCVDVLPALQRRQCLFESLPARIIVMRVHVLSQAHEEVVIRCGNALACQVLRGLEVRLLGAKARALDGTLEGVARDRRTPAPRRRGGRGARARGLRRRRCSGLSVGLLSLWWRWRGHGRRHRRRRGRLKRGRWRRWRRRCGSRRPKLRP